MKLLIQVGLLCAGLISTPLTIARDTDDRDSSCIKYTLREIQNELKSLRSCNESMPITRKDIGTTGYVIDKPGNYCLKEDVVFNPPMPATGQVAAAITIKASPVTLNLGNHRLSQFGVDQRGNVAPTQTPFVVGILVPDMLPADADVNGIGLESIYITGDHAIIDGFSMYGIRVFGHTADIRVSNVTVKNCGKIASFAARTENPALANYVVNSVGSSFPLAFGVGGIAIGESNYLGMGTQFFTQQTGAQNRASSVVLSNVTCLNNFFNGLNMANATDVSIVGCHFDGAYSDDPNGYVAGAEFGGANLPAEYPSLLKLDVRNTTFNDTAQNGDYATALGASPVFGITANSGGVIINQSQEITFENCHCDNTTQTYLVNYSTEIFAFMQAMYADGVSDLSLLNCTFDYSTGINAAIGVWIGFYYPAYDVRVINSTFNNTQQFGLLQKPITMTYSIVAAFNFYGKNLYMDGCLVQDTIATGPVTGDSFISAYDIVSVEGFGLATATVPTENLVFKNCVANRTLAYNGGQVFGFDFYIDSPLGIKSVICENCIAEENTAFVPTVTVDPVTHLPFGNTQSIGIGFFFQDNSGVNSKSYPVSYINCKALNNKGIPFDPFFNYYSAGFYANSVSNHTYYNCEASDNIYGFFLQNCQNMAVRDCRADNNALRDPDTGLPIVNDQGLCGEGFTDLGKSLLSTPTIGIVQSQSLFEFNHAYNNGLGTYFVGVNQNYNVYIDTAATVPLPTFRGQVSTGLPYTFFNPSVISSPVHNISMIK